ncbi:MAG: 16S rRNA (guanine(966)-N(2))-methyltransferase RsmD [Microthrixaceae bacterium]|nr:16S rRNA (guanine(966)-N(2))-methyltransferase RsmD [Microthrixaceae bacterium]
MTRIISGRAGSLTLDVPTAGTRPTSDRVRESLFGALEAAGAVRDAAVLDLYAGSGALGLEAASRGAASIVLVERAAPAAAIAKRNAAKVERALGASHAVRVEATSVLTFLRRAAGTYDLVFIDPPYDLADDELAEALGLLAPRLSPQAIVIVERDARSAEPALPAGLEHLRHRSYGDTVLWWVGPREAPLTAD